MASAAQVNANQANARLSTGPRTEAGKASSSQNATTHGLSSKTIVILPGQEEEFTQLQASLRQQFAPDGGYQELLFHRILHAAWNQHRCDCAEVDLQCESAQGEKDPMIVAELERKMRLLAIYASRAERSFLKYVKELRAAQTEARYRYMAGIDHTVPSVLTDTSAVDQAFDHTEVGKARRRVAERFRNAQRECQPAFDAGADSPEEPSQELDTAVAQTKPVEPAGFRLRDLFSR